MLKAIGYFIESLDDDIFPAPQELVGSGPRVYQVADYLDRGMVYERYRGTSWCRFSCGEQQMGSCDLTDGVWIWPEGLSHYLRFHSVRLPEEFIQYALSAPSVQTTDMRVEPDYSFWVEWALKQRSTSLRKSIEEASAEASRLSELARNEAIQAATLRLGEGDQECLHSGCSRRALNGMMLCAHHLPGMSIDHRFPTRAYSLSQVLRDYNSPPHAPRS